jgi:hypothetical protein
MCQDETYLRTLSEPALTHEFLGFNLVFGIDAGLLDLDATIVTVKFSMRE